MDWPWGNVGKCHNGRFILHRALKLFTHTYSTTEYSWPANVCRTLSFTQMACERSFSVLKFIKTHLGAEWDRNIWNKRKGHSDETGDK